MNTLNSTAEDRPQSGMDGHGHSLAKQRIFEHGNLKKSKKVARHCSICLFFSSQFLLYLFRSSVAMLAGQLRHPSAPVIAR